MANVSFKSVPAVKWAQNQNNHYNVSLVPWFRATGQPSDHPNAFTPNIGRTYRFESNVDATAYNYIYNKTDTLWPQDGDFDKGFSIQSPRTSTTRQFNYRIVGGKGHWLPCPIFKTVSFYWSKESNDGAWYLKHLGLVVKNAKTDEEKVWGSSLNSTNSSSRIAIINNDSSIKNLGPDWFIYGVVFNLVRPATSSSAEPKARLVDFRLGYECSGLTGTNKLILPKQMAWNNFASAMQAGQMKYEPA